MSWWRRPRRTPDAVLSCAEVADLLQQYLDDESDEPTARLVSAHLEDCRRCGLEADVYRDIKASLARRRAPLPEPVAARLRHFGALLAAGESPEPG
jgi:anti-sigma factor RsiW